LKVALSFAAWRGRFDRNARIRPAADGQTENGEKNKGSNHGDLLESMSARRGQTSRAALQLFDNGKS
jgi:hypothetical protein